MKNKIFFILLLLSTTLFAGTTGKIAGKVTDAATGEPLPGVNVIITSVWLDDIEVQMAEPLGAATNINGEYFITNIPPGVYTVRFSMIGYATKVVNKVNVSIDFTTRVDVTLSEEAIKGEEVVIIAQKEVIRKDLTATTSVVNSGDIDLMPVTEVSEVINIQAGMVDGHLRGGRSGEIAYMIDGVPVTDFYDGSQVVEVSKDMVQELQVLSGTFNAEYGQAMSGIINITTKESFDKTSGNVNFYLGDYVSNHSDKFMYIDNIDPLAINNIDFTLNGPLVKDKIGYIFNVRNINFDGWLYGKRRFKPNNIAYTDSLGVFHLFRDSSGMGDNKYVPMNWSKKFYAQGKLIFKLFPGAKFFYNFIYDDVSWQDYDRYYKYNPDGNVTNYKKGMVNILRLNYSINPNNFFEASASYYDKSFKQYLYKNPHDSRYCHPYLLSTMPYSFLTGGTNNHRFERQTKTLVGKFDYTSQLNQVIQLKTGVEFKKHEIFFEDITLRPIEEQTDIDLTKDSPFIQTRIMDETTLYHSKYTHNPYEFSGYIQTKLEFLELIVNLGIRFDYFEPDGKILTDETDPTIYNPIKPQNRYHDLNGNGVQDPGEPDVTLEERQKYWYKDAKAKYQISPRFGASFPISDRGVFHFSYGHFFQMPRFEYLYMNPDFELGSGTGNVGVIGNADLKPEKTVSGELGLQQQITNDLSMDVTVFFRDIRNLIGTSSQEIVLFGGSARYSKLVNSDNAFVKGFILSLYKSFSGGLSASFNYTYQIAKGTASDPQQMRNALVAGILPEVQYVPLNWDQRHTVNLNLNYSSSKWSFSLIGNYGSGLPYTPRHSIDISEVLTNAEKKPYTYNFDLRMAYRFRLLKFNFEYYMKIYNLLDHLNEVGVFDDTGRAGYTTDLIRAKKQNVQEYVNTLEDFFLIPTHFSEPRRIEMGIKVNF